MVEVRRLRGGDPRLYRGVVTPRGWSAALSARNSEDDVSVVALDEIRLLARTGASRPPAEHRLPRRPLPAERVRGSASWPPITAAHSASQTVRASVSQVLQRTRGVPPRRGGAHRSRTVEQTRSQLRPAGRRGRRPPWNDLLSHSCHETRQTDTIAMSPAAITAGHDVCPRQDSNLRSRLRRPDDRAIRGVLAGLSGISGSPYVSPMDRHTPWFVPRVVPRRAVGSVDQFEAFVLVEVGEVLDVEGREREFATRQQAAIQLSLVGLGRPRSWAVAVLTGGQESTW